MGSQRCIPSALMPSMRLASAATSPRATMGTAMSAASWEARARPRHSAIANTRTAVVIRHVLRAA